MEKAILDLMQLIKEEQYEIAKPFAAEISKRLQQLMDDETSDDSLVRLAKMHKIVEDLQQTIKSK
ncbi:hypothetical protein [Myroides sp. WP-1]|uniref:hypothetical protein n=1 Tax=Myroides sp. WP-1 TaxID=2759944 RepID=UPI0015F7F9A9|nr:hypothetical protein [Myroides sp. WP-1]MBB1139820.1 hypothetical protein [Myroides sp. WP-1]